MLLHEPNAALDENLLIIFHLILIEYELRNFFIIKNIIK